jgi:hypothetical protein
VNLNARDTAHWRRYVLQCLQDPGGLLEMFLSISLTKPARLRVLGNSLPGQATTEQMLLLNAKQVV